MTFFVIAILIGFIFINYSANHIPKTGRDADASGEIIEAVIVNRAKSADRSAVMKLVHNKRRFQVKMKPTEAHLWIKGDTVRIILSKNTKKYRVLFGEYFRENEARIRDYALSMLEKRVNVNFVAAKLSKYTKESFEAIKASKLESQRIYTFVTLMGILDIYTVVTGVAGAVFLIWCAKKTPSFGELIVPLLVIVVLIWMLYNTNETCKGIIKKAEKERK